MSGTSSVGGRGVYEAGDQRNAKDSELNNAERYKEGQPNSHLANDSSMCILLQQIFCLHQSGMLISTFPEDERSIANKLARETKASYSVTKNLAGANSLQASKRA